MALEAIFIRDDIRQMAGPPSRRRRNDRQAIWSQELKLGPLMEADARRQTSPRAGIVQGGQSGTIGTNALRDTLNSVSAKLCREFAGLLIHEGKFDRLKETLARLISQHTASSELLLWLAKDRTDSFADILGPEVFRAMLTAMERDQFNEKRSNRLRDYILDDQELLVELIGSADLEVIKDLTRALQLSPCFDDMDKRSLLARIVKSYPAIQSLISGEQTKQESTLVVSWESLERRKNEYHELVREEDSRQLEGNCHRPQLRRLARKPRIQGRQGNAEDSDAPQNASWKPSSFARAAPILPTPRTDVVGMGTVVRAVDLETNQSRDTSPFSARGIPIRTKASSATFPPSPRRSSTKKSARKLNLKSTAFAIAIASKRSKPSKQRRPLLRHRKCRSLNLAEVFQNNVAADIRRISAAATAYEKMEPPYVGCYIIRSVL